MPWLDALLFELALAIITQGEHAVNYITTCKFIIIKCFGQTWHQHNIWVVCQITWSKLAKVCCPMELGTNPMYLRWMCLNEIPMEGSYLVVLWLWHFWFCKIITMTWEIKNIYLQFLLLISHMTFMDPKMPPKMPTLESKLRIMANNNKNLHLSHIYITIVGIVWELCHPICNCKSQRSTL